MVKTRRITRSQPKNPDMTKADQRQDIINHGAFNVRYSGKQRKFYYDEIVVV